MREAVGVVTLSLLVGACGADSGGGDGTVASGGAPASTGASGDGGTSSTGNGGPGSSPTADSGATGSSNAGSDAGSHWAADSGATSTPDAGGIVDSGASSAETAPPPGAAPKWSDIYTRYLATGTVGHCGACHAQITSAPSAYSYISTFAFINGTQSTISSLFAWSGGPMPPGAAITNAQAASDVTAWIAAGALDN